jgi:hypothetical protein
MKYNGDSPAKRELANSLYRRWSIKDILHFLFLNAYFAHCTITPTNRYLYRFIGGAYSNSLLDFENQYVIVKGSQVGITVDTRLSNFNARLVLTANVYIVASGGFAVTLGTTSLFGATNVVGTGYIFWGRRL